VRASIIVAVAALIAVIALVATAGPGRTQAPGTIGQVDSDAFRRLAPPPLGAATTSPTTTPRPAAGVLEASEQLRDPAAPPLPTARPGFEQPRATVKVVVKPTPTPRPVVATATAGGGSWRRAEYSWYGPGFYGSGTACGQTYSRTILGVAHKTLPCGTRVTFRNPKNGRTITVKVIDRGPYVAGRMWDLSRATCAYLGNCYTAIIQYKVH
jgi:hypothetical protein